MSFATAAKIYTVAAMHGIKRKYTGEPYWHHCAEVAKLTGEAGFSDEVETYDEFQLNVPSITIRYDAVAAAWLHDVVEDTAHTFEDLALFFSPRIVAGVGWLTDREQGNRKERKRLACLRLGKAPNWVKTIKCADLISNTTTIVKHDPDFAKVYMAEKRELLPHLVGADPNLWARADNIVKAYYASSSRTNEDQGT